MVKILAALVAALSILNSSGASRGATEKVAALVTALLAGFKNRANAFFIGLSYSIPTIIFYSFSISLLSVYRLVLWGWGLRTDRVYITLSQPCTAVFF